jgi:intracellular multiplication protein IcmD
VKCPAATLAAHGISVPSGVSVKAVESSDTSLVVTVPPAGDGVASNITNSFTSVTKLITAGSYLAGLAFSISAIMQFKQHKDNPSQVPVGTTIALVFISAALLFLPTIVSVGGQTPSGE